MIKSLMAAVLGGITVFIWGAVSWTALPWHTKSMQMFTDEEQVAQALTANAPVSGVYILPNPQHARSNTHPEVQEKAQQDARERMKRGPFAFVAVTREGVDPDKPEQYLYALAAQIAAALLIICLLAQADDPAYLQRMLFVATVGAVIAIAGHLQQWIWWRFSTAYTAVDCADAVIGWLLAGIVMAAFTGSRRSRLSTLR